MSGLDDFEEDYDTPCPSCRHVPTRYRDCNAIGCEDGYIDLYEDDPLWYDEEDVEVCRECNGTGVQRWCPACGADIVTLAPEDGDVDPEAEPMPLPYYDE